MKKYIFLLAIISVSSVSAFSQVTIFSEQLLGDWRITGIEGKHVEQDIIGSVFHFNKSGIVIADPANNSEEFKKGSKKGYWEIVDNKIVLYEMDKNGKKDDGLFLLVKKYDDIILIVYDEKADVQISFERTSN